MEAISIIVSIAVIGFVIWGTFLSGEKGFD